MLSVSECYQVTAEGGVFQCHTDTGSVLIATLSPSSDPATMSWRFKASKYKNAAPIEQKKELQLRNLSIGSFTGKFHINQE